LKEAREAGCRVVDGVDMFVYQGALQFEWWTGLGAPVEVMRRAVLTALAAR
jgi:shikimate dehydrogenase